MMSNIQQSIEELDAVLHWRGKHAQAIRERDALQQLLNQRDEQVESLKMRPQGEPVARHPDAIIEGVMTSVGITHAIYASTVSLKHGEQVKLYAEQPAPVAVVTTYKPGLYAVRHIDNWDGERDVALTFAMLDTDGKWTNRETGDALLAYRGDKILRAWPLDCSEAPDTQIIGVPRNWLEDWALELVEAAQDGGQMSNQVEHLLEIHSKP